MNDRQTRNDRWTNEETRTIAKWLNRDAARETVWKDRARQCIENARLHPRVIDGSWTLNEAPLYEFSQWLGDEALPSIDDIAPVWHDLAILAHDRIDWWQIANDYLTRVPQLACRYEPFHPVHGQLDIAIDPLAGDQYVPDSYGPDGE